MAERKPYHHGNLRATLLEASLDVIAEAGPKGLTLREVARRAAVSHNAPYRHFKDKEELLATVAAEGFDRLTATMEQITGDAREPLERLRRAGRGYLHFAMEAPAHFAVMFGVRFDFECHPETTAAGPRAFGVLLQAVEDCCAAGLLRCASTRECAHIAWSLIHGIATLLNAGLLKAVGGDALSFADLAMKTLVEGMAGEKRQLR